MLIIHEVECVNSDWEGGSSSQWFIFPPTSEVEKRDFIFRISTASVKNNPSVFSEYKNYNRFLIPISAPINLEHQLALGTFTQFLQPFELGFFDGNWTTKSEGIASDFNLIIKKEIDVAFRLIELESAQSQTLHSSSVQFVFLAQGEIKLDNSAIIAPCLIQLQAEDQIEIEAFKTTKLIAFSFEL